MKTRKPRFAAAALTALMLSAHGAWAETNSRLADAQKAYADVDYESTRKLAMAAIQQGGNDHSATRELYVLWGTAAAALERSDEARGAFVYALASNPELKLERSLSPKLRAPYLEAKGLAATGDGKPPLAATLQRRKQQLELGLRDTLHVTGNLELATRSAEDHPFVVRRFDAAPVRRLPTPAPSELQFFLRALDRYGNVLFELGTEDEPRQLAAWVDSSRAAAASANPQPDASPSRTPYLVTAVSLGALGLAAGGVASALFARRENAARDWNGPRCEQPGSTRLQQCASIDERRQKAEYLAIGFTATGAGLLLGGLVSLLLAPNAAHSAPSASVAVEAAPGNLTLRLRTTL